MYFSYPVVDYMAFDGDTDAAQALRYINNLGNIEDMGAQITAIEREGSYYRVYVMFDVDDATGYQAWLDGKMWHEEKAVNSIIDNTFRNWNRIKNRLNSSRRRRNRLNSSRDALYGYIFKSDMDGTEILVCSTDSNRVSRSIAEFKNLLAHGTEYEIYDYADDYGFIIHTFPEVIKIVTLAIFDD